MAGAVHVVAVPVAYVYVNNYHVYVQLGCRFWYVNNLNRLHAVPGALPVSRAWHLTCMFYTHMSHMHESSRDPPDFRCACARVLPELQGLQQHACSAWLMPCVGPDASLIQWQQVGSQHICLHCTWPKLQL